MILQVLLSVESDLLGLHLPVLDINLVSTEDNGNVFTHPACQWSQHKLLEGVRNFPLQLKNELQDTAHRHKSLCHVGTFLYVSLEVTSNMMIAHWP